MCMHKKQKNEYNVLNSYVKYKVNETENYKSSLKFLHNHLDIFFMIKIFLRYS